MLVTQTNTSFLHTFLSYYILLLHSRAVFQGHAHYLTFLHILRIFFVSPLSYLQCLIYFQLLVCLSYHQQIKSAYTNQLYGRHIQRCNNLFLFFISMHRSICLAWRISGTPPPNAWVPRLPHCSAPSTLKASLSPPLCTTSSLLNTREISLFLHAFPYYGLSLLLSAIHSSSLEKGLWLFILPSGECCVGPERNVSARSLFA